MADEYIGRVLLGKLEVIRLIGSGGMGNVYEVEHRLTGHRRALKVVRTELADRPRFMKRLMREAKVAGRLNCPFVVETYDAGRLENGAAYVLMELLKGRSLFDALSEDGPFESRRIIQIMCQIAEGIEIAHRADIVHRDLKPENIFLLDGVEGEEQARILDFGVSQFNEQQSPSRLTADGTLVGTPFYMSPEQAAGREMDGRTDIYAMGVMLYEALSGRLPFEADTLGELFIKIGAGEYVPLDMRIPNLAPGLVTIVHRALMRKRADRFQTAEAMRAQMLLLLQGGRTAARAKTISSGPRGTVDYEAKLPRPTEAGPNRKTQGSGSPPGKSPSTPAMVAMALRETQDSLSDRPPDLSAPTDVNTTDLRARDVETSKRPPGPEEGSGKAPAKESPLSPLVWAGLGAALSLAALLPLGLWLAGRTSEQDAQTVTLENVSVTPLSEPSAEEPIAASALPNAEEPGSEEELPEEPAPEPVFAPVGTADQMAGTAVTPVEPVPSLRATPRPVIRPRPSPQRSPQHSRAQAAGLDPNPYP